MNSLWLTTKKILRFVFIFLFGALLAGLEVKYPEYMGYKIFNEYTISVALYYIYDQIKHNTRIKLW